MQAAHIIPASFRTMATPEDATSLEYLQASRGGTYSASTICGCNTRKYHGLLVVPQPQIDEDCHVLLAALDEKVLSEGTAWRLSTHRYTGIYYPEGYRYIREFIASPIPKWTYRFGNTVLQKELQFIESGNILLIRYTVIEASSGITLNLMPLLTFRNVHTLCKANEHVNRHVHNVPGGVAVALYPAYTPLYLQLSGDATFMAGPCWYDRVEYPEEQRRGYDFHEDMFKPGYFTVKVEKGQSVIFAAGLKESRPETYQQLFCRLLARKKKPQTMEEYLWNAASQFLIESSGGYNIKAGYYWFGAWSRDTAIALPGITLLTGQVKHFLGVVDTLLAELKDGLLPNTGIGARAIYNTVDASLWLIWALQQYVQYHHKAEEVWCTYGARMQSILSHYKQGTLYGIRMDSDGLITAGQTGYELTWMDAMIDGVAVTPRDGKAIEVNALWYNAVCFCLELAHEAADEPFLQEWQKYPAMIRDSFVQCFWDEQKRYLADCVNGRKKDWSVRPNQLFAVSLPYSPLPSKLQAAVMDKVRDELLTPKGLRTLSPQDEHYHGHYGGDQTSRDRAYHQGTVWPWLLGHFGEAYLKVYKQAALPLLEEIYNGMAPALHECCLYSIAELFDGDYPYKAGGAVAQAWSVAELLRLNDLIDQYKQQSVDGKDIQPSNRQFSTYY